MPCSVEVKEALLANAYHAFIQKRFFICD